MTCAHHLIISKQTLVLVTSEMSRDRRKAPLLSWFQMDMDTFAFVIFLACNHENHKLVKTCLLYQNVNLWLWSVNAPSLHLLS